MKFLLAILLLAAAGGITSSAGMMMARTSQSRARVQPAEAEPAEPMEEEADGDEDGSEAVPGVDYEKGGGFPSLDEQKKRIRKLRGLRNARDNGKERTYAASRRKVLEAITNAHTAKEDLESFAIDDPADLQATKTAAPIVKGYMAVAPKASPRHYASGVEADLDHENRKNIIGTDACQNIVTVHMFTLYHMKGIINIVRCKHDGRGKKGKNFYRIFMPMPLILEFTYCQGASKKQLNDATQGNSRAPIHTDGNLLIDILNGDRILRVLPNSEGSGAHFKKDCYVSGEWAISYHKEYNKVDSNSSCHNWRAVISRFDKDTGRWVAAGQAGMHQWVLATCRHYLIHPALAVHHLESESGCLAKVLGLPDKKITDASFWDKFECRPISPDEKSLINGKLSPTVGGETTGIALTKGQISRTCDGDHLFGRERHNNGVTRVMGCSHRENILRSNRKRRWIVACLIANSLTQYANQATRIVYYNYELQAAPPGSVWTNVFFVASMGCAAVGGFCQLREEIKLRRGHPERFPPHPLHIAAKYLRRVVCRKKADGEGTDETLDAVGQLASAILSKALQIEEDGPPCRPVLLVQCDQFGIAHAPFAQGRAFLTERGYGICKVLVHQKRKAPTGKDVAGDGAGESGDAVNLRLLEVEANDLAPAPPDIFGSLMTKNHAQSGGLQIQF